MTGGRILISEVIRNLRGVVHERIRGIHVTVMPQIAHPAFIREYGAHRDPMCVQKLFTI